MIKTMNLYAFETVKKEDKTYVSILVSGEEAKELIEKHCYKQEAAILHFFYEEEKAKKEHEQCVAYLFKPAISGDIVA
jgi:hypothetical protein